MTRREQLFAQVVLLLDLCVLTASAMAAYWIRDHWLDAEWGPLLPAADYVWVLWVIGPAWVLSLRWFRLFDSTTYHSARSTLYALTKAHALATLLLFSTMYLTRRLDVSRLLLQIFLVLSFVALAVEKVGVRIALARIARSAPADRLRRVLVVGRGPHVDSFLGLLRRRPHWRLDVAGVVSPDAPQSSSSHSTNGSSRTNGNGASAGPRSWSERLGDYVTDEVVAVSEFDGKHQLDALARACAERGTTFRVMVDLPSAEGGRYRVEELGGGRYLLSLEMTPAELIPLILKRILDIAGAAVGLMLCGVVYLWYRRRVRKESPGPVLYCQRRVAQSGRQFTIYKFRTMYPDAESRLGDLMAQNQMRGHMFKLENDPRVIPSGHFMRRSHLDELPQFWNVLRGEMSMVGTRPPTIGEVAKYRSNQLRRLSIKPGITGLWQLNGNAKVSDFDDVVRLDCDYIDNWSLWLDMKVLARTVVMVFRGRSW